MKFGANSLIWTDAFDLKHLPLLDDVKGHGFDGIEIARFSFSDFPAAMIGRAAEAVGLETIFCSALIGDLSLISDDPAIRKRASDFISQGIYTAAQLGARTFVGPYCAPVGLLVGRRRNDDEWKRAVEGLQRLGEVLDLHEIDLAIEPLNRFETYFLNTAEDAARLCDEVGHPRIGVLFDTFHANIEEKNLGEAIVRLGGHIKHVHTCENDRGIPGSGHVEWNCVFPALKQIGYDGWAVIESFGFAIKDIAAAACIWRDIAPSPEVIAWEGVKFLRRAAGAA